MANMEKVLRIKSKTTNHHQLIETAKSELGDWEKVGDQIRFVTCPICGSSHPNNLAFCVDPNKGTYKCFVCNEGGHLSKLLEGNNSSTTIAKETEKPSLSEEDESKIESARDLFAKANIAVEGGTTDNYLKNRSIRYSTWSDLDQPLRESFDSEKIGIAIYPFQNQENEVVAIQRVLYEKEIQTKTGRKYLGKKGLGVSILKDTKEVIVAEGLETGLSVRQHLGNSYGLIICGDAGNMKSLASNNSWALKNRKTIIVAADNDVGSIGVEAARSIFCKFPQQTLIFMPSLPKTDWNDVLQSNKMSLEWI